MWAALSWQADAPGRAADQPEPRVYRDRIEPHWYGDGTHFWYRVRTARDAHEFVLVDALRGERQAAFDHHRLASVLTHRWGTDVRPDNLPIDQIAPDHAARVIELFTSREHLRLRLDDYSVSAVSDTSATPTHRLPAMLPPQPTERTGAESSIVFENQRDQPVLLYWLDFAGRRNSYGQLAAGERREQHTFGGHQWLVTDRDGREIAAFEAEDQPRVARLDNQPPRTRAPAERQRGRGRDPSQSSPQVSPDGRWAVFVRAHDLWLRGNPAGDERRLTEDGDRQHSWQRDVDRARGLHLRYELPTPANDEPEVYWAPDSARFIAVRSHRAPPREVTLSEPAAESGGPPATSRYPYYRAGDALPRQELRLFPATDAASRAVPDSLWENPFELSAFAWQADSSEFRFLFNQRGHQRLRWIGIDGESGASRVLIDETSATFIDYAGKFFLHDLPGSGEAIWMSERSGWNHLYLYDAAAGVLKQPITRGDWVVRGVEHVDADARQVWFWAAGLRVSENPYHRHLCRVQFDGTGFVQLTEGDGTHEAQFSPDRRFLIDRYSRVDLPPIHELRDAADGRLICRLEEADAVEWFAAGRRFPERFHAQGRDGQTDIFGVLHFPRAFDPQLKYPVIESIYAGPHGAHAPHDFRADHGARQELADSGFVVVQIDGLGTAHRSKAFHDVCWQNLADAGFPDRILWLREAARTRPYLDLERVGIYGGSAGGQSAVRALLDHGDFYRAAAADCGCHDNRLDKLWWNELWMGWPVAEHYQRQSNATDAGKLSGALLLSVGALDRNVDPAATLQLAVALSQAGRTHFELLYFPDRGHGAIESDAGRRQRITFFQRHLQDRGPILDDDR